MYKHLAALILSIGIVVGSVDAGVIKIIGVQVEGTVGSGSGGGGSCTGTMAASVTNTTVPQDGFSHSLALKEDKTHVYDVSDAFSAGAGAPSEDDVFDYLASTLVKQASYDASTTWATTGIGNIEGVTVDTPNNTLIMVGGGGAAANTVLTGTLAPFASREDGTAIPGTCVACGTSPGVVVDTTQTKYVTFSTEVSAGGGTSRLNTFTRGGTSGGGADTVVANGHGTINLNSKGVAIDTVNQRIYVHTGEIPSANHKCFVKQYNYSLVLQNTISLTPYGGLGAGVTLMCGSIVVDPTTNQLFVTEAPSTADGTGKLIIIPLPGMASSTVVDITSSPITITEGPNVLLVDSACGQLFEIQGQKAGTSVMQIRKRNITTPFAVTETYTHTKGNVNGSNGFVIDTTNKFIYGFIDNQIGSGAELVKFAY